MWDSTQDAQPVYQTGASAGPRLGFLGALEAAYDDQVRNSSVNGLAYHFMKADEEQAATARKNGVDYQPFYKRGAGEVPDPYTGVTTATNSMRDYYSMARTIVDNEDNNVLPDFAAHDAKIIEHNAKGGYQLKTMKEMFDGVKEDARKAQEKAELGWTWPGVVGGVIGGAAGGFNPATDPANLITAPLGGAGKSVFGRIAAQAGIQGVTEGINQLTGVQENRRLLGLDYGVSNAAFAIGGAAVGGALLQGALIEPATAVLRRVKTGRWFDSAAHDVAPPQPAPVPEPAIRQAAAPEDIALRSPLADSRIGVPRAQSDLTAVHNQLSDWGGPKPYEMAPPTATRIPGAEPRTDGFTLGYKAGPEGLDSIARRVDPETFEAFDKYAATKNEARQKLESLGADRNSKANTAVQDINDKIDDLRQKTDGATRRLGKKYEARIAELEKQRDAFLAIETKGDTLEMATVRQELMNADYAMRDLAPSVTRAYANAQNKWQVYEGQRQQIAKMIRDGEPGVDNIPVDHSKLPKEPPEDLIAPREPIPERAQVAEAGKPNEAIAATIAKLNEAVKEAVDDVIDTFAKFARTATKEVAEGADKETHITLTVNGKETKLALDGEKISIPTDDGGVVKLTPRELLKEVDNDNQALQAVSTCSLNATS